MKKIKFALLGFVAMISGCDWFTTSHDTSTSVSTVVETSSQTSVMETGSEEEVDASNHSPVVDTNQSTVNTKEYQAGSWSVYAPSSLWKKQLPPINTLKLFLVNSEESLAISYLQEKTPLIPIEYVNHQVDFIKSLKTDTPTLSQVTLNGIKYYLISSPGSNFDNWQWILVEDGFAHVWSCGGPRNSKPSMESCMTVMTTLEKHD